MPIPPPKMAWLLKQNKRYAPLLDTALKLAPIPLAAGAILALPMLFLFNGYLGQLNQPAVPVSQASDWVFLLIFSILTSILLAGVVLLPATWTAVVRWNAPGLTGEAVRRACAATAMATLGVMLAYGYVVDTVSPLGLLLPMGFGGLAGGLVAGGGRFTKETAFACVGFALSAMLLEIWVTLLWLLLSPLAQASAFASANWMALGLASLLVAVLMASIFKPAFGVVLGVIVTGYWVTARISPNGGNMIASALYSANLGGGRPAQTGQPEHGGEICNLGIGERPLLYFEPKGCSRDAAFRRLHQLKGKSSLDRRSLIRRWNEIAKQHQATKPCAAAG